LETLTAFEGKDGPVPGRKDITKVSEAQLKYLHPRVKKEIDAHRKAQASNVPPAGYGDPGPQEERGA